MRKYGEQIKEQTDNELFDKYMDIINTTLDVCDNVGLYPTLKEKKDVILEDCMQIREPCGVIHRAFSTCEE